MKLSYLFISLLFITTTWSQTFEELDGVKIEKNIKVKDGNSKTKLVLNGYGVRDKMWINLYVQSLYLPSKETDGKLILNSTETIGTRLHVTSSLVSKKKLIEAIEDGVKKTYNGDYNDVKDDVELFMSFFQGEITQNGFLDFIYTASDETTSVYVNEELIGQIKGLRFRRVLFGVWLEESPIDKTLKRRLLGR